MPLPPRYYRTTASQYPPLIEEIGKRIRLYMVSLLYSEEPTSEALKRWVLADIEAGEEQAMRVAAKRFSSTNPSFPFTAWNFGSIEESTGNVNYKAYSQGYFSDIHNCFIYARPMVMTMPMITFYSHPNDYYQAWTILERDEAMLTRLYVPLNINGVDTSVPMDLNFKLSKGRYAHAFSEHLKVNNIYDISHSATIKYHDIACSTENIRPVESMLVYFDLIDGGGRSLEGVKIGDYPSILSFNPVANSVNVTKENPLVITFNQTMDETSDEFTIYPLIETKKTWDLESKVLTITPIHEFSSNTTYTLTFPQKGLRSFKLGEYVNMFEDLKYTFTTGV